MEKIWIQICINMSHNDATRWNNKKDTQIKERQNLIVFLFVFGTEKFWTLSQPAFWRQAVVASLLLSLLLLLWIGGSDNETHPHTERERREKNATGRQSDTSSCLDSQVPRRKAFTAFPRPSRSCKPFVMLKISFVFCLLFCFCKERNNLAQRQRYKHCNRERAATAVKSLRAHQLTACNCSLSLSLSESGARPC